MRPSQKGRGSRNKSGRNKPVGNIINRVFESAGPEGKVRGTPQQIIEKYQLLARDAQTAGERVLSENFLQHAEHYTRLLNAAYEQAEERRQQLGHQGQGDGGQGEERGGQGEERGGRGEERGEAGRGGALETIESAADDDGPVDTPEGGQGAAARAAGAQAPAEPASETEATANGADAAPKKAEPRRRRRKTPAPEAAEAAPAEAPATDAGGA